MEKAASSPRRRSMLSRLAAIRVKRNAEKAFIRFFRNTAKVKSLKSLVLGKTGGADLAGPPSAVDA
jgi:hypothetical protein